MGAWNATINGNDTAQDLKEDYTSVFYYYEVPEALKKLDEYVRETMFDESDEEEWCDYYYSLADFMWKKGILTDEVRKKAVQMIDTEFGMDVWKESGDKAYRARVKELDKFKKKLLSPQPAPKKIRPSVYLNDIFEDGDIIAIKLLTEGKPYANSFFCPMDESQFHSYDSKYIVVQKITTYIEWESPIVPDVKSHWAVFRLLQGIYDDPPEPFELSEHEDARLIDVNLSTPLFYCESSMFYFRKRKYKIIGHDESNLQDYLEMPATAIYFGINHDSYNADSFILTALFLKTEFYEVKEDLTVFQEILKNSIGWRRYDYSKTEQENKEKFDREAAFIYQKMKQMKGNGGRFYIVSYGINAGMAVIQNEKLEYFFIIGRDRKIGLGTRFLKYLLEQTEGRLELGQARENEILQHMFEKCKTTLMFP